MIYKISQSLVISIALTITIAFFNFNIIMDSFRPGVWIFKIFLFRMTQQPMTLYFALGMILSLFRYKKLLGIKHKMSRFFYIYAVFFAFFIYIGKSYYMLSNWSLMFASIENIVFSICIITCCMYVVYWFLSILYILLNKYSIILFQENIHLSTRDIRKIFFLYFIINIIFLVIFYPGTASFDGQLQLNQFFGFYGLTNHHPVLSTIFEGFVFSLGTKIFDMNFGIFLCVFIQILFQSVIFTYAVKTVYDISKNRILVYFVMIFYALNPIFPLWGICLVKDTIYYDGFLWMFLILIKIYLNKYDNIKCLLYQLFISTLLVCIFRNNGVYVVIPTLIFLYYIMRSNNYIKKIIIFNLVFLSVFLSAQTYLLNYYNIRQSAVEALTIPFQQTARLLWANKDIDEQDKIILNKIFGGKNLKEIYKPEISDPIKGAFLDTQENMIQWKYVYFKYLTIYPSVYVQAVLNQNYGYFYIFREPQEFFIDDIRQHDILHKEFFNYDINTTFSYVRRIVVYLPEIYRALPILSLTYSCAFYIWIIIFLVSLSIIKKEYNDFMLSIPLVLSIGVCLLSPVNADFRYMLPIVVSFPVFVVYYFSKINCKKF